MNKLETIIGDYESFLAAVLKEVEEAGFNFSDFVQLDHMGYRAPTRQVYDQKSQALSEVAELLDEIQVNGRPIAVFRLRQPIQHGQWRIDTLEVLAPREGVPPQQGLEHIEFVLYDAKEDFLRKYADKQFNLQAADRGVNPEIGFKLPSYGVKFHLVNLPTVVYLEQKLGLTDIDDSK